MKKATTVCLAAGLAALALTGCSSHPGMAASVAGTAITQAEVDTTARALAAQTQVDLGKAGQTVVANEVLGAVARQIAAAEHVTLDDAARANALDAQTAALRSDPQLTHVVDSFADLSVVSQKLGYEKFVTACQQVPVEVNPRYGDWSAELCTLTGTGSLSKPAPTAAPAA